MRRIRTMGLCLVAAFVMSAVATASASAAPPEYKVCKKVTTGATFSNKECTTAGGGGKGYVLAEWNEGKKHTFKSKSSAPKNYLLNPCVQAKPESTEPCTGSAAVGSFTATGSKAKGELTGPKSSTFVEEFKGVKSGASSCNSPGQGKGKIKTNPLETTLVPLYGGKVGEVVKAVGGGVLAEYTCAGVEIHVKGAVIAVIEGASGPATKTYKVTVSSNGGNPNELQEQMYVAGTGQADMGGNPAGSVDNGLDYFEFVVHYKECVVEGVTPAGGGGDEESLASAEGTCAGEVGGPFFAAEGYAPPGTAPIILLSEVGPPVSQTLPAAQNGSGEVKGEAVKIV